MGWVDYNSNLYETVPAVWTDALDLSLTPAQVQRLRLVALRQPLLNDSFGDLLSHLWRDAHTDHVLANLIGFSLVVVRE
jgi:hypothetical protein